MIGGLWKLPELWTANGRAPTSSLDAGKRTPAPTATTARASRVIQEEEGYTLNHLSRSLRGNGRF